MAAAGVIDAFTVPSHLEAAEPPEVRGLRRDAVRLLVSDVHSDTLHHSRFSDLPEWLSPGDVLVVNTSGTLNAALAATSPGGSVFELHLSTRLPGNFWVVEVRRNGPSASLPYRPASAPTTFDLDGGGQATLLAPYPLIGSVGRPSRLWLAALQLPIPLLPFLERFGRPIRYGYVSQSWPSSMYQTVFATEPGSAEMPSAGRPFTDALVTRLVARGVQIVPLLLHTGVASLEDHEPPYEEFYRVPPDSAERVNAARRGGHRIIAVGTTVVRAVETVTDVRGITSPGQGWTDLVVGANRPLRSVAGMITGFHEPRATHLALVEQVIAAAGGRHAASQLQRAYRVAREAGYLWHEFGDSHLVIGRPASASAAGSGTR